MIRHVCFVRPYQDTVVKIEDSDEAKEAVNDTGYFWLAVIQNLLHASLTLLHLLLKWAHFLCLFISKAQAKAGVVI
jgi:hypothetical protein